MNGSIEIPAPIAERIAAAKRWFVVTGAGISAESGVPTFRGTGGLWEGFRPEQLASPDGFRADPALVWRWYRWRRRSIEGVEPNEGHRALASLERNVASFCLATQNVDGLHRRAGTQKILELHGNIVRSHCMMGCGAETPEDPLALVPLCSCGATLRPSVVWFGEMLPGELLQEAIEAAARCDVCLVVGTSAVVYPAAALPQVASRAGSVVIEVNPESTPLSDSCDLTLRGPAAEMLPAFLTAIGMGEEPAYGTGV